MVVRPCAHCTQSFTQAPSRSYRYCSVECRRAAEIVARKKVCASCGAFFWRDSSRGDKQIYCNHTCATTVRARRQRVAVLPEAVHGGRWIALPHGRFALVDHADFVEVDQHVWFCSGRGYAVTKIAGKKVPLHNFLLGPSSRQRMIDHVDRDPLNNRRGNLRWVTHTENRRNSRLPKNNTSGFRGVSRNSESWVARIGVGVTRRYLGFFASAEEAAHAYDQAARVLHGEFAQLNFPDVS